MMMFINWGLPFLMMMGVFSFIRTYGNDYFQSFNVLQC